MRTNPGHGMKLAAIIHYRVHLSTESGLKNRIRIEISGIIQTARHR
ncbi:MAG: hypothetical protein K9L30_18510 [Desulfobacterales bacterium]|nr:hypothetical protein [Desulfobacterales bacterium]